MRRRHLFEFTDLAWWPDGLRTIFDGLHHFRPPDVVAVLRDAARARQPIAAFEVSRRARPSLLSAVLIPVLVVIATPWVRPFRWSRLVLTYLIPVAPLVIAWDGAVSHLRAYTGDELLELAASSSDTYAWQAGTDRSGRMPVTYLVGVPAETQPDAAEASASSQDVRDASSRR